MMRLDDELQRLMDLDEAVRVYLSHLYALEQGAEHDERYVMHWREQLELLTSGEMFDPAIGGDAA